MLGRPGAERLSAIVGAPGISSRPAPPPRRGSGTAGPQTSPPGGEGRLRVCDLGPGEDGAWGGAAAAGGRLPSSARTRPGLHPVPTRCQAAQPSLQPRVLEFPSGEMWRGLRSLEVEAQTPELGIQLRASRKGLGCLPGARPSTPPAPTSAWSDSFLWSLQCDLALGRERRPTWEGYVKGWVQLH